MTEREEQILAILREEPMIAQKDLAQRLGIERSSAAVHIANLVKKGHIQGKGYIINDAKHVVVVGGSNMDIVGRTPTLQAGDSAQGKIGLSAGGVGRNIAEALAKLDVPVKLLSAVGADANGDWLLKICRQAGVDVSAMHVDPAHATSIYMAMLGDDGDLAYAINAMGITETLSPSYLNQHQATLKHAKFLVIDANLSEESLTALSTMAVAPMIADPVSAVKATKLNCLLPKLFGIKPNRLEAQILTGIEVTDLDSAVAAVDFFLKAGVSQVVLTLGEAGVVAAADGAIYHFEMPKVAVVNATGAGDVFTAAWVSGLHRGLPFNRCMKRAMLAAYMNLMSAETIHQALCTEQLDNYEKEVLIHEQILRHPS